MASASPSPPSSSPSKRVKFSTEANKDKESSNTNKISLSSSSTSPYTSASPSPSPSPSPSHSSLPSSSPSPHLSSASFPSSFPTSSSSSSPLLPPTRRIICFSFGSQNIKFGFAEETPKIKPFCIAYRRKQKDKIISKPNQKNSPTTSPSQSPSPSPSPDHDPDTDSDPYSDHDTSSNGQFVSVSCHSPLSLPSSLQSEYVNLSSHRVESFESLEKSYRKRRVNPSPPNSKGSDGSLALLDPHNVSKYDENSLHHSLTYSMDHDASAPEIPWTITKNRPYICCQEALHILPNEPYRVIWPIRRGRFNINPNGSFNIPIVLDHMERILRDILDSELKIPPSSYPLYSIGLCLPDTWSQRESYEIINLFFNVFHFKEILLQKESVMAAFGGGYSTCCIIDSGAQCTNIICIEDGVPIPKSHVNLHYGGDDITDNLLFFLQRHDHFFPFKSSHTDWICDFLQLNSIKERSCYFPPPQDPKVIQSGQFYWIAEKIKNYHYQLEQNNNNNNSSSSSSSKSKSPSPPSHVVVHNFNVSTAAFLASLSLFHTELLEPKLEIFPFTHHPSLPSHLPINSLEHSSLEDIDSVDIFANQFLRSSPLYPLSYEFLLRSTKYFTPSPINPTENIPMEYFTQKAFQTWERIENFSVLPGKPIREIEENMGMGMDGGKGNGQRGKRGRGRRSEKEINETKENPMAMDYNTNGTIGMEIDDRSSLSSPSPSPSSSPSPSIPIVSPPTYILHSSSTPSPLLSLPLPPLSSPSPSPSPFPTSPPPLPPPSSPWHSFLAKRIPLHFAIYRSILSLPSLELQMKICQSFVLSGGNCKLSDLIIHLYPLLDDMVRRISRDIPQPEIYYQTKTVDLQLQSWKGISIVSKLDSSKDQWITQEEWRKMGPRSIREKAAFPW